MSALTVTYQIIICQCYSWQNTHSATQPKQLKGNVFLFHLKTTCKNSGISFLGGGGGGNHHWPYFCTKLFTYTGLQITVSHRTTADQNLSMSDQLATMVRHFVWPIVCCNIWLNHLLYSFQCSFVFMSDQIFLLSDQNGALVRHMSFQGKKIICSPAYIWVIHISNPLWPGLISILYLI